jgi:hypothetical protein
MQCHTCLSGASQLALNEYADQTWEEFSSPRLGYRPDLARKCA